MKKNKSELLFEAWLELLKYLDHHKVQGRIVLFFVGLIGAIHALNYSTPNIVIIIDALK